MVAKHLKHMSCITRYLPPVEAIAHSKIVEFGLENQVKSLSGDFFKGEFWKADIVVMGNILHDWDEETKVLFMRKAYGALSGEGTFVAIEGGIYSERKNNVFGLMMSLNMLIVTGTGFNFTLKDFDSWAKIVGFKSISIMPLKGP